MAEPDQRGVITAAHPNGHFDVTLPDGRTINASLHGKLRAHAAFTKHRIHPGDAVLIARSPYDQNCGLIRAVLLTTA